MLTRLQFNILFYVGVGGAVLLLIGPEFGLTVGQNPIAATGVGAILTFVLTQKEALTKNHPKKKDASAKEEADGSE